MLLTTKASLSGSLTASGITTFDKKFPETWGPVATSDEAAATVGSNLLIVVSSDGSVATARCMDCVGVVWSDEGDVWLVTRDRRQPDFSVDLLRFSPSLDLISDLVVRRIVEEQDPDRAYGEYQATPPRPLLFADGLVYLGYLSVNGGVRAGPEVLARHDVATGELVDFVYVDGGIETVELSDDGLTLAVVSGGSGGACVTRNDVQLFERDSLREVPVDSLIPGKEWRRYLERTERPLAEFDFVSEPWLTFHDAQWVRGSFVVSADVHNPLVADCDDDPEAWVVAIDGNDGTLAATTRMAEVQDAWARIHFDVGNVTSVDGTCENLVVTEGWGDGLAHVMDDSATDLEPYGLLGGGSGLPDDCWPAPVAG